MRNNEPNETIIHIDGFTYHTNFTDFHLAMNARVANQPPISFQPWQLANHLRALGACLVITANGIDLNHLAFSRYVLTLNQIPDNLHAYYAPLALWWSSGGNTTPVLLALDCYQLGANTQARLKPWSCAQRLAALAECRKDSEQGTHFDLSAYLNAMLQASVVAIDTGQTLDELDSAASSALLSAVIALNIRDASANNDYLLNSKEVAALTLRLCRALGWTPSQVMATPAVEIDLILALLDKVEFNKPVSHAKPASTLAAYPDAIVIQVEDD